MKKSYSTVLGKIWAVIYSVSVMKTTQKREQDCARQIGGRLRLLRKARNLTQIELAEMSAVNPNYLGKVERGEITISISKLLHIADSLDVSIGEIIEPCWKPSIIPVENIRAELKTKIAKLSDLNVMVLDRIADYLKAEQDTPKEDKK